MAFGKSIAVVGSGISGLSAAWLLSQRYNVRLYEREARVGGHSNTVDVPAGAGPIPVDTGFIVYNTASYPNLIALFEHLRVPTAATSMGFSVSLDEGHYEYSGSSFATLIGQPRNVLRIDHWRMITDVLRFFRRAKDDLPMLQASPRTLGAYLAEHGYSQAFITRHILPMAAAIWSTPSAEILNFPAAAFMRFFDNHGLLQVSKRPQWRTVVGGSREYVRRLLAAFQGEVALGTPVRSVRRTGNGVEIATTAGIDRFDACVLASHADETLALLADADADERRLLAAFRYTSNRAVLHRDPRLMPKRRGLWSSWNYFGSGRKGDASLSVTYWMNALQPLATSQDLFVTLNPQEPIDAGGPVAEFDYMHPIFDEAAMAAQRNLWSLQGHRKTWFCGSYFGYGFHEDGLQSGLAVAEDIGGVRRPWTVVGESDRLQFAPRRLLAEAAE